MKISVFQVPKLCDERMLEWENLLHPNLQKGNEYEKEAQYLVKMIVEAFALPN